MKINYIVRFDIDNGYTCGCCSRNWTEDKTISIEVNSIDFFNKKSNHSYIFTQLAPIIKTAGDEIIAELYSGNEFDKTFKLIYSYYNEDIGSDVEFVFPSDEYFSQFNLQERWKEFEEKREKQKESKRIK